MKHCALWGFEVAGISKKRVKTKNGEKIKYTISYTDVFGKQHTSGIYETRKEALKDLKKFENPTVNQNITYGFILQEFINKVKTKNAQNTYDNYYRYYNMYFKQFDNIDYSKINSLYWQNVFDDIATSNSPHVAAICLKMCKAAVNHFIKHEILEKNVFNKIDLIKPPKADINHLTIDEIRNVLDVCKKAYREYYPLLFTFIGTGAREGEILALKKTDFKADENCIVISKQFNKGKLLNHPKTASSNRKIYLFNELTEVLKEQVKKNPESPLLFPNKSGKYILPENLRRRVFYPLLELCGINKRVRLHDLRGSYIDMVLSSGLSVKFAQNQCGHSKSDTTLNIYAQNNSDMIQSATNQLNCLFKKSEQNLSKNENDPNKKIIPFRKKQSGTRF